MYGEKEGYLKKEKKNKVIEKDLRKSDKYWRKTMKIQHVDNKTPLKKQTKTREQNYSKT